MEVEYEMYNQEKWNLDYTYHDRTGIWNADGWRQVDAIKKSSKEGKRTQEC